MIQILPECDVKNDVKQTHLSVDGVHRHLHRLGVLAEDGQFQKKNQQNQQQAQKGNKQPSAEVKRVSDMTFSGEFFIFKVLRFLSFTWVDSATV